MNAVLNAIAAAALAATPALAPVGGVQLSGAGATFPNPLYQRWVTDFEKVRPDARIDYQSIGSGGGIKAITDRTVAFAGSDAPMSRKELEAVGGADKVIEIPSTAGGVVPAYNLPTISGEIRLTGPVLAEIFMGKISSWNDPKLAELNKGVDLPNLPITPAWRTDGSGTTYVFTNYLATQSEDFKTGIGMGKQVRWPVGQGGKGNEGVAAAVQGTPGAIGYIELNYAAANGIAFASVRNQAGTFVSASPESISAAGAAAAATMTGNLLAANIWNQPGADAYPIAAFTYIIAYKDLNNLASREEAQALADFLWWAAHDGQGVAGRLQYAPLAGPVQEKVGQALRMLTYKGQKLDVGGR